MSGVASDTLLGTEKLEGGTLSVQFDKAGLAVRGDARVGGDRAQVEIRQDPKGRGEATLSLTLDNAARQKRGLGPEAGINGPVAVRVTKALGKGVAGTPRVEADLTRAALEGAVPGLSKPAGRAAKLSFLYRADADGPDLDDLVFDSNPVLFRGKVELTRQNAFDAASLSQVRLSTGDNLKVDARREGSLTRVVVRGAVADVRPFIRDLQSASGPAARAGKPAGKGGDLDLDLDVPILTGFNNEAITTAGPSAAISSSISAPAKRARAANCCSATSSSVTSPPCAGFWAASRFRRSPATAPTIPRRHCRSMSARSASPSCGLSSRARPAASTSPTW
ncbi:MAG: hypothetical protein B7Z14_18630 [Bosea sp. 32-68-6]|nr:MAG: hypothetical protein B7Z14_18630 [Bosea sp. 32-68-6]